MSPSKEIYPIANKTLSVPGKENSVSGARKADREEVGRNEDGEVREEVRVCREEGVGKIKSAALYRKKGESKKR